MTTTLLMPGLEGSAPKSFFRGAHRLIPPEETVERARPLMPVMGITRIANVTGLDTIGIPVVMVCRPNSRSISVSQGKGMDLAAAKASGVMESVEGYHAEHITLPLKLASYEELRYTHHLVDISQLPRLAHGHFHPHLRLLWVEGYDLLHNERVWVPYEMVHLNYTLPLPPGTGCFIASSNGLASGNHLLEAISHGLCELVERDATTLWCLLDEDARNTTRLDLDSVDDPWCLELLDMYRLASICVSVWEMTSDVGIPAFVCLITERAVNPLRPIPLAIGSGCHPARQVALLRALTEAAQSRLTQISGSRDDLGRDHYLGSFSPRIAEDSLKLMQIHGPLRNFRDVPTSEGATFEDDVAWELERLRAAGITSAIALDLTKPEFNLPVVRVVIPGLEPRDSPSVYVPGRRARALLEKLA